MPNDTSTTQFNFKAQLDTAVNLGVLCTRFEWYGPASFDNAQQCPLLHAEVFNQEKAFDALEATFHYGDLQQPSSTELDHVLIYVFDGSDGTPKFHAHLWKPGMGRDLANIDYAVAEHTNPYQRYVLQALLTQTRVVKVSTVVNQAFVKVRKAKSERLPELPLESDKVFLRDTLMRLRHTDPLIFFHSVNRTDQPHFSRTSMVEHLGIYDRDPTWNHT